MALRDDLVRVYHSLRFPVDIGRSCLCYNLTMLSVSYPHIETTLDRQAVVSGTQVKVVEIALDHLTHHWDAEEIQRQYPALKLGEIHSALAFYFDHQAEMDQEIESRLERETELLAAHSDPALRARLQAMRRT